MTDIKIIETGQGGDISIVDGIIEIDSGIFNNIYLSLFGGNLEASTNNQLEPGEQRFDWWGNFFINNDESKQFNSRLEKKLLTTALTSGGLTEIESVALRDLRHLEELATITVEASIIALDTLRLSILAVEKETGIPEEFIFIWDNLKRQIVQVEEFEQQFTDIDISCFLSDSVQEIQDINFEEGELGFVFADNVDVYSINDLGELVVTGLRAARYYSNNKGQIFFNL